jgi:5-methylcytosine-specific restriction protein A
MDNLVRSKDDILQIILVLEKYKSSKNEEERDFFNQIIKAGTCFVVSTINDKIAFSPSKFIGYKNNDCLIHKKFRDERDGRDTNRSIEGILNTKFVVDGKLESQYLLYCEENGIKPNKSGSFGAPRKFINLER